MSNITIPQLPAAIAITGSEQLEAIQNGASVRLTASQIAGLSSTGVTSVGMTVPSFLSVAGSPITSSGTFAVSYSGTPLPAANGGTGLSSFASGGVLFAASPVSLATSSSFVFDGTNVGIGTSSPSYPLQVSSTGNAVVAGFYSNVTGTNDSAIDIACIAGNRNLRVGASDTESYFYNDYFTGSSFFDLPYVFYINSSEKMRLTGAGNLGIGTNSPSASAIVDAQSTSKGVRFPNMTTTQKNAISSPAAGLVVFDTTLAKLCVYTGAAWQTITSV